MRAATRILALAALVLVGACASGGDWRVADGPWEDGSVILESPDGALMPACLDDALCDDSRWEEAP